ncbi:MAG: DUF1385 domain-containing protein [Ruminococcaceae bacterium]|nr:DUF1385 domain-containing protein [Oscillospiraceae bacterium]
MAKKQKDPKVGIVGGQAVLEGVMMKSGDRCSLAVRTPDGIVVDNTNETSLRKKYKICNIPIIRGCVSFIEQLFSAMNMLTKSADMQGIDLDEPETKFEKWLTEKLGDKLMAVVGGIGMVLGIVLAMGLFLLLPTYATRGIDWLAGGFIGKFAILRSFIEGLIRIIIFVLYVWLVSFMPDIRRTYEYHGAEHKSVDCFEKGLELTPENAMKCSRFHPRCGTSFIFVMLIISIIVNSFLEWDVVWIRFASKLITLPLIIGVGYEFIRYAGAHNNILTKILSAPGLWMQRITTQEPDLAQLEVALVALKNAIPAEFGGIDEPNYDPETKKMIKPQSEEESPENPTEDAAE